MQTWRLKGLPNDGHNPGRQRKGQQGSRVLQSGIGSRGAVGIGRRHVAAAEGCAREYIGISVGPAA